ncbi:MAG: glucans biosynthesis glucosyltransferase MdoH [Caulobacteraceae bacterium]
MPTAEVIGPGHVGRFWLPPEAPLAMPVQDFRAAPARTGPAEDRLQESDLWRVVAFGLTALAMIAAGAPCRDVLEAGGFSPLELLGFALFEALFGWISFSLVITLSGVASGLGHEPELPELKPQAPLPRPTARTAILMPIHNEDPGPVFARLAVMTRSLREARRGEAFDLFVLSDTRDPDIARQEQAAFERLRAEAGEHVFYRRRAVNAGRKSGNVADWVRRFGDAYAFMVVLDADSLMTGEALARLAGAMEAHPEIGLIQTAPRLIGRTSLFGRMQQFASRLYGPALTHGLALFWGTEGNYWGHNAILRVRAFAENGGLPSLPGRKPFGGDIMSHDFVEAALLRRAGWQVRLAPGLSGSYEECPPTLTDMAVRDRRWCQGNIQHLGVVGTRGLHWMSRFHMLQGAMGYLMSPLWLLFLGTSTLLSLRSRFGAGGAWDIYGMRVLSWVLAVSILWLMAPRLIALGMILGRREERRAWGDPFKLAAGVVLETLLSALVAPILMVSQSRALFDILIGRDSGWAAQTRDDGGVPWGAALARHGLHLAFGAGAAGLLYLTSGEGLIWAAPVVTGLVLAAPIAVLTADPAIGLAFLRSGLLATPEEIAHPPKPAPSEPRLPVEPAFGVPMEAPG